MRDDDIVENGINIVKSGKLRPLFKQKVRRQSPAGGRQVKWEVFEADAVNDSVCILGPEIPAFWGSCARNVSARWSYLIWVAG